MFSQCNPNERWNCIMYLVLTPVWPAPAIFWLVLLQREYPVEINQHNYAIFWNEKFQNNVKRLLLLIYFIKNSIFSVSLIMKIARYYIAGSLQKLVSVVQSEFFSPLYILTLCDILCIQYNQYRITLLSHNEQIYQYHSCF